MLQHCCVDLRRELIDNLGLDRSSPRSSPPPCTPLLLGPCALAVYYKQPRSVISFCTFPVIFYIFQSSPQLYCSCIKQPTYSRLSKFQSELTLLGLLYCRQTAETLGNSCHPSAISRFEHRPLGGGWMSILHFDHGILFSPFSGSLLFLFGY